MLSRLVFPGVPRAQTASLHPAAQLQHSSHNLLLHITSPTPLQQCLKEGMPVGFSCHEHKVTLGSFLDVPYTLSTMRQQRLCQQTVLSLKEGCEQNQGKDQLLAQEQVEFRATSDTAPEGALEMQTMSHFWNTEFLLHI